MQSLQILKDNGSNGYLVGNSLTFADIGLLEALLAIKDYYEPEVFEDFPEIEVMNDEFVHFGVNVWVKILSMISDGHGWHCTMFNFQSC